MVRTVLERAIRVWREAPREALVHAHGAQQWIVELERLRGEPIRDADVLDIGCGDRAPLALALAAHGANVTAIDILPVAMGRARPLMWMRMARSAGLKRTAHAILRDVLHTFRYWRSFTQQLGTSIENVKVKFRVMDAQRLSFTSNAFDVVISSAVWEHLPDIRLATRELRRVLRPGGIAVIQVALFASIEGGHHATWHSPDERQRRTLRPWDHLYPDAAPLPLYCNRLRESEYEDVFQSELAILKWERGAPRGRNYLSGAVRSALAGFTEQELLTPFVTVWATKGPDPPRE